MKRDKANKEKLSLKLFAICTFLVGGLWLTSTFENAYGDEGGGGGSGGVSASCSSNALTVLCGYPAGSAGGGASWRIFKSDDGWGLDDWTGYGGGILTDSYKAEAMSVCREEGWFASYGWDGMVGSYYGYSNYNFQIGPANRYGSELISQAEYNDYDAKSYSWLNSHGFPNNTRITWSAAAELYYMLRGTTWIPDGVGYFCVSPDQFQGLSQTNGTDAGWAGPGAKVHIYNVDNCDINGCNVDFNHYLRRTNGSGATSYHIDINENNLGQSGRLASGSEGGFWGSNAKLIKSVSYTMYPGQYMCQTLYFDYDYNTRNVSYKVCALALRPASNGGTTSLSMGIRNNTVTPSGSYQKTVYAKPDDTLSYQPTYVPGAQYPYQKGIWPQRMVVNGGGMCASINHIGTMLQSCGGGTWANGFMVTSSNFASGQYQQKFIYANGDTGTKTPTNTHKVSGSEVGRSLSERAETNSSGGVNTVPKSVGFENRSNFDTAIVDTGALSDSVQALIPYNFRNGTEVTTKESGTTLYAGSRQTINYTYIINPKANSATTKSSSEKYATTVHNPKWHLELCVGDSLCENGSTFRIDYQTTDKSPASESERNSKFNVANMWTGRVGDNAIKLNSTINVPDIPAGTRLCLRSAVWPASSGADTNWNDRDGDHQWARSAPSCFTAAKKPSIQIWGGNVYSSGNITTATNTKGNLAGYNNYGIENNYTMLSFGSWNELGIIANGKTTGFSSGASLGYGGINNGVLSPNPFSNNSASNTPNPGGSKQSVVCKRSPLTFANNCSGDTAPAIGNSTAGNNNKADKSALVSKYVYGDNADSLNYNVSGVVSLNDSSKLIDGVQYYHGGTGTLTIPKTEINANSTQIVHSAGNIFIDGDITYHSAATYSLYSHLPKLVIYAEKNIYINCSTVNRIDAILIAGKDSSNDGNVITCANSNGEIPEINSQERSHQLVIYGAVIANKLVPTRTYGAATGANSIIPAEIINFDPTLYLWGGSDATTSEDRNTNMDITYIKELAPRY